METKLESDSASMPTNDDSDAEEGQEPVDDGFQDEEEEEAEEKVNPPSNNNVANILKRLASTGALIRKPKEEYWCRTCNEDFPNWEDLENHLLQHVSQPSVVLDKLPSDDEDTPPSGDENWSDEEEPSPPPKTSAKTTPQKIDISQLLKKTGISLKKPAETDNRSSDSALSKLSGLGFTIKKNVTPIKKEPKEEPRDELKDNSDVMQKLGKLGGIKLKLKSDGGNTNSFKVINGLKDFKASDDEDEGSGNEEGHDQEPEDDEDLDKSADQDASAEQDSGDEENGNGSRKTSESDDDKVNLTNKKISTLKSLQGKVIIAKSEPLVQPKVERGAKTPVKNQIASEVGDAKVPPKLGRPVIKQTPKRGANLPIPPRENAQQIKEVTVKRDSTESTSSSTSSRRDSNSERRTFTTERRISAANERRENSDDVCGSSDVNMENVVVKQEIDNGETTSSSPLFSGQIKSERTSPPPTDSITTPILTAVKSEADPIPASNAQPLFHNQNSAKSTPSATTPVLPVVPKKEIDDSSAIIEINGDSNDEDDDCCVVSATPAPDIKPVVPKVENTTSSYSLPAYAPPPVVSSSASSSYATPSSSMLSSRLSGAPSTEKQHNFNWNAPDSKPPLDMLEKSADDIFESLLSTATKKESLSLSDASEYISIDTLGPQHTCEVCNTRFTDISLLEEHRRMTGHSQSLATMPTSSSTLLPYNPSSNILSSLLPVKQLAEQVGKLSGMGSGPGFTHQQNVMINIQAYPGAGGVMGPPQAYNSYPPGGGHPNFPQASPNMYGSPGQTMPGQYPGQHYMGQQSYGQYQQTMPKPGSFPGSPNSYSASTPYSTASPLQNMQQAYGATSGMMNNSAGLLNTQQAMGQMGPPGSQAGPYIPASSPGSMKPGSNVRIQNVQTFAPGQLVGQSLTPGQEMGPPSAVAPGQVVGGQMPAPSQIRMAAGATVTGTRPRMPNVRGARPSIRPGIQVHGQLRGTKPGGPRMPLKRPGGVVPGPGQKRRPDMLLPGKHDNEDCQVMAMQKQREGLPMIQSVQGAKDKLNIGSGISITKKPVNKEANAMANVLASRGISVKQKPKSRSPSPERPLPNILNLGSAVSIKHSSKSSNFSIPEAKVGSGLLACRVCKKMFMNQNSLQLHMTNVHPQSKIPMFKCDECPASYPKSLQLQHHKRVFHNVSGPNRELGLPVVDLSQEDNLKRLSNLGIYSFIPLANREQASGCFGIPVVSVQNGMTSNLQALGADGLLSLGPLKPLPNS